MSKVTDVLIILMVIILSPILLFIYIMKILIKLVDILEDSFRY